jgi:hypothetical protein
MLALSTGVASGPGVDTTMRLFVAAANMPATAPVDAQLDAVARGTPDHPEGATFRNILVLASFLCQPMAPAPGTSLLPSGAVVYTEKNSISSASAFGTAGSLY